jgi:predicted ferric reductase
MMIVLVLWVHGGGLHALGDGLGNALTTIGRLTGLIAADLLLIQVLLMARIPWLERVYGQDELARWHRLTGFTSFNLMLAHVVLITVGYAGTSHSGLLHEAWDLVTTYPGMLLATAATIALIMVAMTSIRAARAKLRYESWHLLHLYAYLGVGLSLPHEIWTGADFTAPLAAVYWWTLYGAAAGAILTFRIILPVARSLRHDLRVHAVVPETPGVTSVYLTGRNLHRLPVRAGHFFNWRFLGRTGWTRAQPYSLSAAPRHDLLRITVKDLGDGSRSVRGLRTGTRVLIEGPYGRLTGGTRTRTHLTMIASGIGITPLRALLESEPYQPNEATLIYRASTPADFTFERELEQLSRARGVRVFYLSGHRGPHGSWMPTGYVDAGQALRQMAPYVADSDVFVCGPEQWMASVVATLDTAGVPPGQIHLERFGW